MRRVLRLPSGLVRATAHVLLLALSVTTVGPALHEAHDEELQPVVVVHDESEHHFQAAPSTADTGTSHHCVACHFVRASYGPASWVAAGLVPLAAGVRLTQADGPFVAAAFASPRPARAPPVLA
jgi:hypothetical protein